MVHNRKVRSLRIYERRNNSIQKGRKRNLKKFRKIEKLKSASKIEQRKSIEVLRKYALAYFLAKKSCPMKR